MRPTNITAVQLIGLVDSKLIGAVHKIGMIIMQDHSKCITHVSVVDSMFETASPGPMIVYALTLYSTAVFDWLCINDCITN